MKSTIELPVVEGPGSVSDALNLPAGFTDRFTSGHWSSPPAEMEVRIDGLLGV